jgi:hypothetical protein
MRQKGEGAGVMHLIYLNFWKRAKIKKKYRNI